MTEEAAGMKDAIAERRERRHSELEGVADEIQGL